MRRPSTIAFAVATLAVAIALAVLAPARLSPVGLGSEVGTDNRVALDELGAESTEQLAVDQGDTGEVPALPLRRTQVAAFEPHPVHRRKRSSFHHGEIDAAQIAIDHRRPVQLGVNEHRADERALERARVSPRSAFEVRAIEHAAAQVNPIEVDARQITFDEAGADEAHARTPGRESPHLHDQAREMKRL